MMCDYCANDLSSSLMVRVGDEIVGVCDHACEYALYQAWGMDAQLQEMEELDIVGLDSPVDEDTHCMHCYRLFEECYCSELPTPLVAYTPPASLHSSPDHASLMASVDTWYPLSLLSLFGVLSMCFGLLCCGVL